MLIISRMAESQHFFPQGASTISTALEFRNGDFFAPPPPTQKVIHSLQPMLAMQQPMMQQPAFCGSGDQTPPWPVSVGVAGSSGFSGQAHGGGAGGGGGVQQAPEGSPAYSRNINSWSYYSQVTRIRLPSRNGRIVRRRRKCRTIRVIL